MPQGAGGDGSRRKLDSAKGFWSGKSRGEQHDNTNQNKRRYQKGKQSQIGNKTLSGDSICEDSGTTAGNQNQWRQ